MEARGLLGGCARRQGGDGVKEGTDPVDGSELERLVMDDASGFSGEAERLSPRPSLPGLGPGCLHLISTPSAALGLSPAAPGNIPSERQRQA